jgi:hypothetical protein
MATSYGCEGQTTYMSFNNLFQLTFLLKPLSPECDRQRRSSTQKINRCKDIALTVSYTLDLYHVTLEMTSTAARYTIVGCSVTNNSEILDSKELSQWCINTQNYLVFRLCPSSGILESKKHNVSESESVSFFI